MKTYDDFRELHPDDRKTAITLLDILGRPLIMSLFSTDHNEKLNAYNQLLTTVKNYPFESIDDKDRQRIFVALFALIDKGVTDRRIDINQ